MSARETTHLIVETIGGRWYIISSLSTRNDSQVITIERYTGRLLYTGQPGIDLFATPRDALHFITGGRKIIKSVTKYHALIGYCIIGPFSYLVGATKVSIDLVLPPNHKVFTIAETAWLKIPLGYPFTQPKFEAKNAENMTEFQLNGLHYYSETLDLTHRFPSTFAVQQYDSEFVWNEFITDEFRKAGLGQWCCVLMQGMAVGKIIPTSKDSHQGVTVSLIYKRSSLNPGTRYLSRGLNAKSSPGNEYEVECITYKPQQQGQFQWSSYIWRRGTVPIHWKSELNSPVVDAEIIISPKPYEKVDEYYKRIVEQYGNVPITIVNLLRAKNIHPDEGKLSEHYEESLQVVKKLMSIDVDMISYDWHTMNKHENTDQAVNGLWKLIGPKIKMHGVTSGTLKGSPEGNIIDIKIWKTQSGLFRINCADSLDRTNLVSFFIALHAIAEQFRSIGVHSLTSISKTASPQESWTTLNADLETIKASYDFTLLLKFAEMFITAGDNCATLFTNTVAMHTSALREFAKHLPEAPSNVKIIVERRYQNVMKDAQRQQQYEMFLGLKWAQYFPSYVSSISNGQISYVTPYPSYIFKAIPAEMHIKATEEHSLLKHGSKYCWICPRDFDFIEVHIYLPYYCRVTEFAITTRHGISESSSPSKMDVFVGSHIDDSVIGFQDLTVPRCEDNTKLLYSLPPQVSGLKNANSLYDFYGTASQASSKMRVVRFMFYGIPPGTYMTLGQIQVFGVQEKLGKPPKDFYLELKQIRANDKIENIPEEVIDVEATSPQSALPVLTVTASHPDMQAKRLSASKRSVSADSLSATANNSGGTLSLSPSLNNLLDTQNMEPEESKSEALIAPTEEAREQVVLEAEKQQQEQPQNEVQEEVKEELPSPQHEIRVDDDYFTREKKETVIEEPVHTSAEDLIKGNREKYGKLLLSKCPRASSSITFLDALELEITRMKLGLSPQERDSILIEYGFKAYKFDPNSFVFKRDEVIEKKLREKIKSNSSKCSMCKVGIKLGKFQCHYCRRSFCKNCTYKDKIKIPEFAWTSPHQVCIECSDTIRKQQKLIDEVQNLSLKIEKAKEKEQDQKNASNFEEIFTHLYPPVSLPYKSFQEYEEESVLSEFPSAGILSSVPTAEHSPPVETILLPTEIHSDKFWYAPHTLQQASIIIVLPCYTSVSKLVFIADQLGYRANDMPELKISFSQRLPQFSDAGECKFVDFVKNKEEESNQQLPSNVLITPNQKIQFTFTEEAKKELVRLIKLEIRIPKSDENTSAEKNNFIHLGRVLVYGKAIAPPDYATPLSPNDQVLYENIMKLKPKTSRVQINTTVKLWRESNTVDHTIGSANAVNQKALISGFRLQVEHGKEGIQSQAKSVRVSVLAEVDEEGHGKSGADVLSQIIVGTFTIPRVASGTSLSYEFDRNYEHVSLVRFEFLENYGSQEYCIPKSFLFVSQM